MAKGLTKRQEIFVAEYLTDLNATRSAISAGYSEKSAESQGAQQLRNPKVAAEIAKKSKKRLEKLDITAERVLNELALLGFANMLDYMSVDPVTGRADVDLSKLTREQAAAIQEITVDATGGGGDGERRLVLRNKFRLASKRESLELLGKHLKLFTERIEVSGLEGLADAIARGRARALAARESKK